MPNPLDLLRRPSPLANDPADLYDLEGQLGDEAELRTLMAQRAGAPAGETAGLNGLAKMYKGNQQHTLQGMQPTPEMAEMNSAISQGYGLGASSPVQDVNPVRARNVYLRQQAQEKMRQPIQQEELQQRGATARQNIAAKQATDVAQIGADSIADRQNNYVELMQLMGGGGRQIDSGTLPGRTSGGSFNFTNPTAPPNQQSALNQMAIIRGNLTKAGVQNPFQNFAAPKTQDEANFVQMVNGFLGQTQFVDPQIKTEIVNILRDPTLSSQPFEQLYELPPNPTAADIADHNAARDFFIKARGY